MKKQLQLISPVLFIALANLTSYGQQVGDLFTVGSLEYKITSATNVEVVDYTATGGAVTIPPTVDHGPNTYTVTAIGAEAFSGNGLTSVVIPNTVTSLKGRAFLDNQLTGVVIPEGVESISSGVFRENDLTHATIPNSVTSIGASAFRFNQLTEVSIGDKVASIGSNAFGNNPDLRLVELLGNSPPGIHQNTFWRRDQINLVVPKGKREDYLNKGWTGFRWSITDAQIGNTFTADHITYRITDTDPNSRKVSVIDYNTAEGPTTVNIPSTIQYQEIDYAVTSIGSHAFARTLRTDKLTSVIIPNGVKSIGTEAFRENLLSSVTIPNSVISIGNNAFNDNELTAVTFESPGNLTSIGASTFKSNDLTEITIPGGVITIGNSAFSANQLISVDLPGSVTHIDLWAFANGSNQKINTIFVQATTPPSIEENTFGDRSETTVVVPDGARENYENNAKWTDFKSITEAADAEIVNTFTVDHITYEVTSTSISLEVKVKSYSTAGGTVVTIPQTVNHDGSDYRVTAIGEEAFLNKQLTKVTIPNSVTSIGASAFADNKLTSVTIPESVTSIGDSAFMDNDINSVVIPTTVTSIGISAFWNNRIASLEIPGEIADIGENTFGRNNLASVTIPASVTSIGSYAFLTHPDEPGITQVTVLGNTPPTLAGSAFSNRNQIDVVVPKGKRQAYLDNGWTGFKSITEEKVVTAIRNYEFKDFTLYPNPARDKVYIDLRLGQKIKQVNIYTMTGAYLYSENGLEINTSHLSEGMYLFEIVTKTGARSMKKVIIQ